MRSPSSWHLPPSGFESEAPASGAGSSPAANQCCDARVLPANCRCEDAGGGARGGARLAVTGSTQSCAEGVAGERVSAGPAEGPAPPRGIGCSGSRDCASRSLGRPRTAWRGSFLDLERALVKDPRGRFRSPHPSGAWSRSSRQTVRVDRAILA